MTKVNNDEEAVIVLDNNTSLRMRDIQLLLNCGMGPAKVEEMITMAKREFVMSHHPRDIFRLPPSSSWKNGCYKTYARSFRRKGSRSRHPRPFRFRLRSP